LSKFLKGSALVTAIAACSLVAAVSAFGGSSATTTVSVTAGKPGEFHFTLSKKTVAKGTVVFKVANKGSVSHDFKIAGKTTPSIGAGKASTLKVIFKKGGKYPFLCTLPGHADAGMKGTLTVK
jgi:uncharacterized cupredoxin-like copper-binding protein